MFSFIKRLKISVDKLILYIYNYYYRLCVWISRSQIHVLGARSLATRWTLASPQRLGKRKAQVQHAPSPRSPSHHQLFAAFSLSRRIVSLSLSIYLRSSFLPSAHNKRRAVLRRTTIIIMKLARATPLPLSSFFSPYPYIIIIIISARSFVRPRPRRFRFLLLRILLLRLLFRLCSRFWVARATWIIITIPPRPVRPRPSGRKKKEK